MVLPPQETYTFSNPGVAGGAGVESKVNAALKTPWVDDIDRIKKEVSPTGLNGYKWNLPPHKWSLPVEPSLDDMVVDPATRAIGATHKYRRGRIYWYARVDNEYVNSNKYNADIKNDPRYGFQFMWNPTEFSTSVATNMSVTPSFADKFASVVGAFPSGQALSISFVLDRTNDFACLNSLGISDDQLTYLDKLVNTKLGNDSTVLGKSVAALLPELGYYPGLSFDYGFAETLGEKVIDLLRYGTTSDLEYIYKAINGPGWTNVATGRNTSEIGFLRPTLLRIDLGPLSYLGYVSSMNVAHNKFTKGMIPMATTVDLQFNLMATAGLVTK